MIFVWITDIRKLILIYNVVWELEMKIDCGCMIIKID